MHNEIFRGTQSGWELESDMETPFSLVDDEGLGLNITGVVKYPFPARSGRRQD